MEKFSKYKYLETVVNVKSKYTERIRIRIEQARIVFNKLRNIFCSKELSLFIYLCISTGKCICRVGKIHALVIEGENKNYIHITSML